MSTPAGWYQNPENNQQLRWWDGNAWTSHTAPAAAPAAPVAYAPSSSTNTTKIVVIVGLGLLAAIVLFIGGCALLTVGTINKVEKELKRNSITTQQAAQVHRGMTKTQVRALLGPPQLFSGDLGPGQRDCLLYHVQGASLLNSWVFCFDEQQRLIKKTQSQ